MDFYFRFQQVSKESVKDFEKHRQYYMIHASSSLSGSFASKAYRILFQSLRKCFDLQIQIQKSDKTSILFLSRSKNCEVISLQNT